jgi:hypothetical protein
MKRRYLAGAGLLVIAAVLTISPPRQSLASWTSLQYGSGGVHHRNGRPTNLTRLHGPAPIAPEVHLDSPSGRTHQERIHLDRDGDNARRPHRQWNARFGCDERDVVLQPPQHRFRNLLTHRHWPRWLDINPGNRNRLRTHRTYISLQRALTLPPCTCPGLHDLPRIWPASCLRCVKDVRQSVSDCSDTGPL